MMLSPAAASLYEVVLAVHIMAVVLAFGWAFALPVVYVVAGRHDPRSLPTLHRIEYTVERVLVNPALTLLVAAGIYLASDGHHWSEFFVQWGLAAAIVIGGLVGAVMIPTAKRAEAASRADLEAAGDGEFQPGAEYRSLVRRLNIAGTGMGVLVLVTILLMVIKP